MSGGSFIASMHDSKNRGKGKPREKAQSENSGLEKSQTYLGSNPLIYTASKE